MHPLSTRTNVWGVLLAVVLILPTACPLRTIAGQKEKRVMSPAATLESLLENGNWDAVEEAHREGPEALATVRSFAGSANSRVRQIAVACAAAIGGRSAGEILVAGLTDSNINVRLQAAKALSTGRFPSAAPELLDQLAHSDEPLVREFLALGAGYLPGPRTIAVLKPLSDGLGALSVNARMALAKLGDPHALADLARALSSSLPRARYDALDQMRYVDDARLLPYAEPLLSDRATALRIGPVRHPRYRRVCDQAVDTVVFLRRLRPHFPVGPEQIYTDEQLAEIRELTR